MKFKSSLKPILAILLVLCTLFSTCAVFSACKKEAVDDLPPVVEDQPQEDNNPPSSSQLGTCSHAQTTLKNVREARCDRDGYTGDEVCTACGAIVKAGRTTTASHAYGEESVIQQATCTTPGKTVKTCAICFNTQENYTALADCDEAYHDAMDEEGHLITCSKCTRNDYGKHAPSDGGEYHAASCTHAAYVLHTCKDCKASYKEWVLGSAEAGHDWGEWELVAESCCENGSKTRTCKNPECGKVDSIFIPKSADSHHYVEIGRAAATCVKEGSVTYECSVCNEIKQTTTKINPAAHDLGNATLEGNYSVQSCERNGCDYEVKILVITGTQAAVNTEDIDTDKSFEVKTEAASVQFPTEVIGNLKAAEDIEIKAGTVEDKSAVLNAATNIDDATKARLEQENVQIFNFSVTDQSGNSIDFGEGNTVVVTIPYTLGDDEDPDGIVVWYVAEDGNIESYEATFEAKDDESKEGFVTFEAPHFSYYAVAYEETQEMKCRRGEHKWKDERKVVEATCNNYGYTLVECETCHRHEILHIFEMLDHNYGPLVTFTATCTDGGYDYKKCQNENCGHVMNVAYHRQLGHILDQAATCTEHSTCQRCNTIVTHALGHTWSDWQIIIEPTATTAGLRRKSCPQCGEYEDVPLAATGSVDKVSFDSYEDLMEHVLESVIGFQNGTASFEFFYDDETTITLDLTFKEEGESYLVLVNAQESGYATRYDYSGYNYVEVDKNQSVIHVDRENLGNLGMNQPTEPTPVRYAYTHTLQFLYRNGVVVLMDEMVSPYHNPENSILNSDDLESIFMMPYQTVLDYLKQCFDVYMPDVEATFDECATLLRIFEALCGEGVNDVLNEFGCSYDINTLANLFDKIQLVYTYLAQRYGFETSLSLENGVPIPNAHDFLTVLAGICTAQKNADGSTTYTLDYTELKRTYSAILTWFEENEQMPVSDLFFRVLGERVQDYYPEVTDWSSFVDKLAATFTGSMQLKDALDVAIGMLEKKDICTLDELYNIIDALNLNLIGKDISSKEYVTENGTITLDEIAQECGYTNIAEFFADFRQSATTLKLADIVLDRDYEYDPQTDEYVVVDTLTLGEYLDMMGGENPFDNIGAALSVTLDANGKILAINADEDMTYVEGTESRTMQSLTASFHKDDNVTLDIPAAFLPVSQVEVEATFDKDGNMLLVLPEGYTYDLSVGGYGEVPYTELVELDEKMSESLGYPVYVLKREFWTNYHYVDQCILYNGNYYSYNIVHPNGYSYRNVIQQYKLSELLADPTVLLPDSNATTDEICRVDGVYYPCFQTALMPVFQKDDVWYAIKKCSKTGEVDRETGVSIEYYDVSEYVDFEQAFANVQVSTSNRYSWWDDGMVDGTPIRISCAYLSMDPASWGTETLEFQFYVAENDDIMLVSTEWAFNDYNYFYQLEEQIPAAELPAHDGKEEWFTDREIRDAAGNVLSGAKLVELHTMIPDYFVKVTDTLYARLSMNYSWDINDNYTYTVYLPNGITATLDTTGRTEMRLPDGNKMYVWGETYDSGTTQNGMKYNRIVYGYAKLQSGLYIQAACRYNEEIMLDVIYREGSWNYLTPGRYASFDDCINLTAFLTQIDATTYKVDAGFFKLMNKLCTASGDGYWISIEGTMTDGDTVYQFRASEGIHYNVPDPKEMGYHYYYDDFYWNEHFGSAGSSSLFSVTPGADGTLTVTSESGRKITVSYDLWNSYPVSSFIPKDEVMSAQTGLDIYSAITGYYTNTYLYEDGKYYYYDWYNDYDLTFGDPIPAYKNAIANDWQLTSLTYKYDFSYRKDGVDYTIPVYYATFRFPLIENNYYTYYVNSLSLYVTLRDGKLHVLTGAQEISASVLQFEDMVLASTYFSTLAPTLTITDEYTWGYTSFYYNGKRVEIRFDYATLTEYDEDNNVIMTHTLHLPFITENGVKKYVLTRNYTGKMYLEKGSEVTDRIDPEDIIESYTETYYANGPFQFVRVERKERDYFIKLAGTYYHYNSDFAYRWYTYDQDEFEYYMACSEDWYYGVYDDTTGTYTYYNRYSVYYDFDKGENVYTLSEPLTTLPTFTSEPWPSYIATLEDGRELHEFRGYIMDNVNTMNCAGGSVFYYCDNCSNSFLKIKDNMYVRAEMITDSQTGASRVVCYELSKATISEEAFNRLGVLDKYVTKNSNGTVTFSRDILDAIAEESRDDIKICIYAEGFGTAYITYDQLVMWFDEVTEKQYFTNGDFNGFVDSNYYY